MQAWVIELCVSPPFERQHQRGVIVHLQIVDQPSPESAQLWTRRFQGMDWMHEPPLTEVRTGEPRRVSWELAKFVLDKVRALQLQIAPWGSFGIHPTTYRLRVQSGMNSCQLTWSDELPPEWHALAEIVKILQSLNNEEDDT